MIIIDHTRGGTASYDEILARERRVRDAFVAHLNRIPEESESGTTSPLPVASEGDEPESSSSSSNQGTVNNLDPAVEHAQTQTEYVASIELATPELVSGSDELSDSSEKTPTQSELGIASQPSDEPESMEAIFLAPVSNEKEAVRIAPTGPLISMAPNRGLSPEKKRSPFKVSNPLELRQLALSQLKHQHDENELPRPTNLQESEVLIDLRPEPEDIMSVKDRTEQGANDSKAMAQIERTLATFRVFRGDDDMPSGLRRLFADTSRSSTFFSARLPAFKDMTKFPIAFLRQHWNLDVVLPAIVKPATEGLPDILVMESKPEPFCPKEPQLHGALLHVSLPTTLWPTMDDMPLFTANRRGTRFTYMGKYQTPRNAGWDNGPILADVLDYDTITRLPGVVKDAVVSKIWENRMSDSEFAADYVKALATSFFPDTYYSNAEDLDATKKKERLMVELKCLEEEHILKGLEVVSRSTSS